MQLTRALPLPDTQAPQALGDSDSDGTGGLIASLYQ